VPRHVTKDILRKLVAISLLSWILGASACSAGPEQQSVDPCALIDPALAASLVGDRTGENSNLSIKKDKYTHEGCGWEDSAGVRSISVDARFYDADATAAAEQNYRSMSKLWKCTTRIASGPDFAACGYIGDIDNGVVVRKGAVVARIGYKIPSVPSHDKARQEQIAQQLARSALAAL
jgi:hypothetical protein